MDEYVETILEDADKRHEGAALTKANQNLFNLVQSKYTTTSKIY